MTVAERYSERRPGTSKSRFVTRSFLGLSRIVRDTKPSPESSNGIGGLKYSIRRCVCVFVLPGVGWCEEVVVVVVVIREENNSGGRVTMSPF